MKLMKTIAIVSVFFSHLANADTVTLNNGDVLTGTVIKKETDKLVFKTKYTGEIKITWSDIASLKTDKPVNVVLADESSFTGEILESEEGRAKVNLSGLNTNTDIDLKDLTYINPSPEVSGQGVAWSGHANLGGAITQGNSDTTVIRFDAETIARTKDNRFTLGGYVNRADSNDVDTEFNSKGYMQYDHFLTRQWYLYANESLEYDKISDINLRSSTGVGNGYQIFEQADLNLSIEGGLNYINVDYNHAEDEDYASARWALKYDHLIFSSVKFFHQHEILVSLEDAEDTLVFTKTGLRVPIAKNLNASTELNIDYDNQPAPNRERVDKTLLFSLGYGW
jgi:putative salt-induced outer membrane protein YdiY